MKNNNDKIELCSSIVESMIKNGISLDQLRAFLEMHNILTGRTDKDAFKCGDTGWDSETDDICNCADLEEAVNSIADDMEERAKDWLEMDECVIDNLNKYGLQFNEAMLEALLDVYGFEITVKPFKYHK